MRYLHFSLLLLLILVHTRCDENSIPTPSLPTGCQSQGVFAIDVVQANLDCLPTNAYTDVEQALGPPDSSMLGPGKTELGGMVSLGVEGSLVLFMGSCVQDLPGPDIRVYQVVSSEVLEVQVSQNEEGPFLSLGAKPCGEDIAGFPKKCDFDLAGSGLNNVRFIKLVDAEKLSFVTAACDSDGLSPGADIDAVEVLHPGS